VGGDAGNGYTKLGITYEFQGAQRFAALLVYQGSDKYEELHKFQSKPPTTFAGESANFPHIFSILQHFIDTRQAFLNGDWPFINTLIGLKSPASSHPCPICVISNTNLLGTANYRRERHRNQAGKFSENLEHTRLIKIKSERIVPTPLHVFLGIGNRIIMDAFVELFGKEIMEEVLNSQVKTLHTPGCGGASDYFELNGPEICKFIKQNCSQVLHDASANKENFNAEQRSKLGILKCWLDNLHKFLLHKRTWTNQEIQEWREAIKDIHAHWCQETGQAAFPKLHMLFHTLEFAQRWGFLGKVSESQIESFHYKFNSIFKSHHLNLCRDTPERLRRCLADTVLQAVQPILIENK
jgi:hypothetical protein